MNSEPTEPTNEQIEPPLTELQRLGQEFDAADNHAKEAEAREARLVAHLSAVLGRIDESYRAYGFEWLAEDVLIFQQARTALQENRHG